MFDTPQRTRLYVPIQNPQEKRKNSHLATNLSPASQSTEKRSRSLNKNPIIKAYHFSDSIYEGQIKAFQRTGKGILIHDNGLCGVIQSGSNRLRGHNIFFGQNIIISAIYQEHNLDFAFKMGKNILVFSMAKKGSAVLLNNQGYLIEYDHHRVSKLRFANELLKQKTALTRAQTHQIIQQQKFSKIMKQEHIKALHLQIYDAQFPHIQQIPKYRNQFHIGFSKQYLKQYNTTYKQSYAQRDYKNVQLNGLGFIIQKVNYSLNRSLDYQFKILQKGFFSKGKLQYFGQQFYQKGNFYFGGIKNGKIDGKGIMVYGVQKRFAFGTFSQGKPIKLEQKKQYRLDTEEGINLYQNLRKKLHSEDPEIWIDGKVSDIPNIPFFQSKMNQCIYFLCEDQEHLNFLKQQQQLKLSRKVQDFQSNYQKSKPPSTITFGMYPSRVPLINSYLHQDDDLIKRRLFQPSSQIKSRRNELNLDQFSHNYSLNGSSSSKYSPSSSNKKLDESIIKRLNNQKNSSRGKNSSGLDSNQKMNSLIGSNIIKSNLFGGINDPLENYQFIDQNKPCQRKLQDPFRNSRTLENNEDLRKQRSKSRSKSRQSRQSRSNNSRQKSPFNNVQITSLFHDKNRSITNKGYDDAKRRAERLEQQYRLLEMNNNRLHSPYKSRNYNDLDQYKLIKSKQKMNNTILERSPARRTPEKYSSYKKTSPAKISRKVNENLPSYIQQAHQMYDKYKIAGDESIRLGHLNIQKQQKRMMYQHNTHKKHFDYTSEALDNPYLRNYDNIEVLRKQASFSRQNYDRTPQKQPKYSNNINSTMKKTDVDQLVNRLYPYNNTANGNSSYKNQKYDSSYEQNRSINTDSKIYGKHASNSFNDSYSGSRHGYGYDYKNNIIRNNAVRDR